MLHCTKSTPGVHLRLLRRCLLNYMNIRVYKYNNVFVAVACCIATIITYIICAPPSLAASSKEHVKPLLLLDDANRLLARKQDPRPLVELARESPSRFVRHSASAQLANHYALERDWDLYERYAGYSSSCALLLKALRSDGREKITERVAEALVGDPKDKTCKSALESASAAGFLRDEKVWRQIRILVDGRKSKLARLLLPLLKDHKASSAQLNKAVQGATKRIRGKHKLGSRVEMELLAVSAIVVARRDAVLAGDRWNKFASHIDDDIEHQVWTIVGKHASLSHKAHEALSYFNKAPLAEHGRFELAWRARAAMRVKDWKELQQTTAAMTGEQSTLPDWRFWNAYAQAKIAPSAASDRAMRKVAREFDSYYGLLAKSLTGELLRKGNARHDPSAEQRIAADADFRMAVALGVSGNTGKARQVWKFLSKGLSDKELVTASTLASREGWILGSINAADRASATASNHGLRFPVPYLETVSKYVSQFQLDPAFVYAIMRQESRFNLRARSSAGARGLMQVMPATAKSVARRHDYSRYRSSRLFLLDTNVIIGTRYIADLRDSIGQDPILIAASYNAGPSNVKRWLRSSRSLDKLLFVETIPFTETRLYVKHVMANMAHYDLMFKSAVRPWQDWMKGRY